MHKLNGYFLKHHLINKMINNNCFTSISVIKYQIAEVILYLNIKLLTVSLYSKIKLLKVSLYCISKIWIWIRISLRVRKNDSFSCNLATCWDIWKIHLFLFSKLAEVWLKDRRGMDDQEERIKNKKYRSLKNFHLIFYKNFKILWNLININYKNSKTISTF